MRPAAEVRGALNKILGLSEESRANGIAAFSAGNHAAAVAAAARIVGCPAVIVVPGNACRVKVENCRGWGAEVVFYDPVTEDREEITQAIADRRGMIVIPPFDDYDIMAGAGTVGLELAEHLLDKGVNPDAVVVNCSGGGLASGAIEAIGHFFPGIEKYIVEPEGYDKMARSLAAGEVRGNPAVRTARGAATSWRQRPGRHRRPGDPCRGGRLLQPETRGRTGRCGLVGSCAFPGRRLRRQDGRHRVFGRKRRPAIYAKALERSAWL